MRKLLSALAVLLVVAPACGDSEADGGGDETSQRFTVDIRPLNGSDAQGRGKLALAGNHLTVDIEASGLEPDQIHEQHLHGLVVAAQEATCPTDSEDDDGDGLVELAEARSAFGTSVRALEPFPTVGGGGRVEYELTFTVDRDQLEPLENRVLVLRGASTAGAPYRPDLPVACGRLRSVGGEGVPTRVSGR